MNKIIHLSTLLRINNSAAFAYFTKNDLLEKWLTTVADVDPVINGKYELFWDPTSKEDNSTIGCKITSFVENEFISFEWRSPKQFKDFANNADPLTHVVIIFIPQNGMTTIHLLHTGWRKNTQWEEARIWQENAWKYAFKQLQDLINK